VNHEKKYCSCGAVAMRHVNAEYFCNTHIQEAYAAAARDKKLQQSIAGLLMRDHKRIYREERHEC